VNASHSRSIYFRIAWRPALFVLLAVLCFPLLSHAQDTGYIGGTVIDKTGAAIAGAEVTIKNLAGSLTRTTVSNGDGAYVLPGLPGDTYDMTVSAKGFQKFTAKKIVLNVGDKARIDVSMTVGAITEEVVVTGESVAQVETTSSDLTSTITGKQIDNLVLNGRNFTQLVNLAPGVVSQTGQDDAKVGVNGNVAYSMNGGRTEYNNWELDGGDNMDNGSNSTLNVYPNPEAIAEFKVLTSNYGAQYGRNGSGTVEVETKSGTSAFHGSAFEYLRNEFFNAKSWEEGADPTAKKAPYKKHDFGYTIGGPIYIPNHYNTGKKKTFFFFSEEWRREKNPFTTGAVNVPSDAERTGNFSDICPTAGTTFYHDAKLAPQGAPVFADCPAAGPGGQPNSFVGFANNTVAIDPVGSALLALIPSATPGLTNNNFPAVVQTVSLPETWREELIRVDHNINDKYRVTFRYIHDAWQTQTQNPLWGNGTSFENINTNFVGPGTSFVARLNANFTPTLLNEFVASYTGDHIFLNALHNPPLPAGFTCTTPGQAGCQGVLFDNGLGAKLPSISLASNLAYGGGFSADTGYFPWNNANPTYTYRDNMTKIIANHTLQFGAYVAFAQKNEQNSPYIQGILTFDSSDGSIPGGGSTGNAFADLLTGKIASFSQVNLQAKYYNRYHIIEPYFQDDWRVTKKFTLNLGLRLSLYGTYRERYRNAFNFEQTAFVNGASPQIDLDGSITGTEGAFVSGTGNPFNGIIQCGGPGGTSKIPGPTLTTFPGATVGSSSNAGCLKGHLFNPAPRVGFAWDPKGDGKMAIRGGYGIFFEHTNGNEGNTESLEGSPPFSLNATQNNINGYGNIGGGLLFPLSVNSIPNKVIWPYVQQWHMDVEKELPGHIVAAVSYVGSKGTHLTLQRNLNQLFPVAASDNPFAKGQAITQADCDALGSGFLGDGTTPISAAASVNLGVACGNDPNPNRPLVGMGKITRLEDQANSIYHALQTSVHRTVGDLTLSLAYTYSHSIDDSSDRGDGAFVNSYNMATNRGSSNFDVRHNLAISYVYGLPFFKAAGLSHTLLGGWQLSGITIAQTGTPFSVTNGTNFGDAAGVANGVGTGSRPDIVGDPNGSHVSDVSGVRGPLLYNPGAYEVPTGLTFGNVGRNTLAGPGRINFDFGLFKRFSFGETRALDFRWETFNLFNHTQYNGVNTGMDCVGPNGTAGDPICINGDPVNNIAASGFLHASGAHLPRRMQFGLRFQF